MIERVDFYKKHLKRIFMRFHQKVMHRHEKLKHFYPKCDGVEIMFSQIIIVTKI